MFDKILEFKHELLMREKSCATVEKYVRDVRAFLCYGRGEVTKESAMRFKAYLCEKYLPRSVNSMISSVNCFLEFIGKSDCRVKSVRLQRQIFADKEKELSRTEYEKLLNAAKQNERLYFVLQTICVTGIRVSELKYITVEALRKGRADVNLKGKRRTIFITDDLCRALKKYAKNNKITSGSVFVTKNGKPLDRSNIWSDMKKLCKKARVDKAKVFPHNLRHLFARTHYSKVKDIVRLADLLGHSSLETTRIYTMESGDTHRKQIAGLGLLRC